MDGKTIQTKINIVKKDENEVTQLSLFLSLSFLSLSLLRKFIKDKIYRPGFSQDQ